MLELFEIVRKAKYPVARAVIMCFGRSEPKRLLGAATTLAADKKKLQTLKAGDKCANNFLKRHNIIKSSTSKPAASIPSSPRRAWRQSIRSARGTS